VSVQGATGSELQGNGRARRRGKCFLRPFGGYLMGRVRFGLRSGFFFLVLAGVAAPFAMTTNAAEGRHQLDVPAQRVHDSGLVDRVYATPSSPAAAPAAVRIAAQLSEAQSTIMVMTPEPGAVVTSPKPTSTKAEPPNPEPEALKQASSRPMPLEDG
jgi:hypothetical protein